MGISLMREGGPKNPLPSLFIALRIVPVFVECLLHPGTVEQLGAMFQYAPEIDARPWRRCSRYAAMAGLGFSSGLAFSARLFDAIGVALGACRCAALDDQPARARGALWRVRASHRVSKAQPNGILSGRSDHRPNRRRAYLIETIGLLSELTIAYKFKFVWSPFYDKI